MRFLFFVTMFVVIMLNACAKEGTKAPCNNVERPDTYRITDFDVYELNRELKVQVPAEYKSPIGKRMIDAVERDVATDLSDLSSAAMRTDITIERIVNFASWLLKRKGYEEEGTRIAAEYYARFNGYMVRQEDRALGDHAPLLSWLDSWYNVLEARLGAKVMRITNLEHIKILNFSIPVVFNPSGKNGDWWDIVDYRAHFAGTRKTFFYPDYQHNGFAGVIAYWSVWGACTAATFGAGGVLPFMCGPVGELSCFAVGKYVAPKLSDRIYCRYSICE